MGASRDGILREESLRSQAMQVGMSPFANISSPLLNPMGAVGSIDAQLAQMQLVLLAAMAKIGQSMTGASGGASSGMTSLEPGFGKASGGKPSAGVSSFLGDSSSGGGKGQAAVDYARQFSGKDSISIKGKMKHFTAAGGITNNCADFVSSALESQGLVKGHHINVKAFEQSLKKQGYRQVPAKQAKPGDVWISASRGHTELVATKGATRLIGSNNNGDHRQEITEHRTSAAGVIYQKG